MIVEGILRNLEAIVISFTRVGLIFPLYLNKLCSTLNFYHVILTMISDFTSVDRVLSFIRNLLTVNAFVFEG